MTERKRTRPLGHRAYGSIPHLPGSKRGPSDRGLEGRQASLLTEEAPGDWTIIVQEKLDGSCVSVAKIDGEIVALGRAGYPIEGAPFPHLPPFARWVAERRDRFEALLREGERVVGEWMLLATGMRYWIPDAERLFVAFDLIEGNSRALPSDVSERCSRVELDTVPVVWSGSPIPAGDVFGCVCANPHFEAEGDPEGLVYRAVRRKSGAQQVSFLGKWVRPDFEQGQYLKQSVWNYPPQWVGAEVEAA